MQREVEHRVFLMRPRQQVQSLNHLSRVMLNNYPAVPSAPPQDIVAVNQTLFTITISWQPVDCTHMNGNIRGYKVRYWERGGNETKMDGNTTGTSYTLTDLQSSTTYVIQVAAENDAGVGVFGNLNASTLLCKFSSSSVSTLA